MLCLLARQDKSPARLSQPCCTLHCINLEAGVLWLWVLVGPTGTSSHWMTVLLAKGMGWFDLLAPTPRCHHALQAKRAATAEGTDIPAIPITVRQLEAVIRIAESLAKMQLQVGLLGAGLVEGMPARPSYRELGPVRREQRQRHAPPLSRAPMNR